jgi:hypothetical protein
MIFGAGIHGLHRALGSVLLTLMLVVSGAPFLNALASMQADCGTQCCRKKKSCCCRKKAATATSTISVSARTCPPGCGRPVGIPSIPLVYATLGLSALGPVASPASPLPSLLLLLAMASLCFALFQRPPPRLLATAR